MLGLFALSALADSEAAAVERTTREGFHQVGKTIWTSVYDLTEIARFPLESSSPSFIVYLESLHPEDSDCTREMDLKGDCQRPDLCHIWVWVMEDLRPVRTEPVQDDTSRVLIAWVDEDTRDGNGAHMDSH
jgi:hypothetical protein